MSVWAIIFFASIFIVFYNYAGYAILVYLLNKLTGKKALKGALNYTPFVSFIVAAYNEEDFIERKIQNSLEQLYPADRIEYLFITDGSTDSTNEIIRQYPAIQLLYSPERMGKSAALNRAVQAARNEVLIFSDANTILNEDAVANIARHYADTSVGGVAGEKKVIAAAGGHEVGTGEGAYWKYESVLKKLDSDFYSVVGAAGELFSLRKDLYEPVAHNVILDDFIISMKVAQKGYRVVYEPDAYAMELPSFSIGDEQKRKVRIAAGGFQAIGMLGSVLQFWKNPKLAFLYISHRLLRWTLSPICLVVAFLSNLILVLSGESTFYKILLAGQVIFYSLALSATLISTTRSSLKLLKLPYYFVFMNVSVIQGFLRFLRGRQPAAWEKAKRSQAVVHIK